MLSVVVPTEKVPKNIVPEIILTWTFALTL